MSKNLVVVQPPHDRQIKVWLDAETDALLRQRCASLHIPVSTAVRNYIVEVLNGEGLQDFSGYEHSALRRTAEGAQRGK